MSYPRAMRLGIVSDTHGLVRPALFGAFDGVDEILHAGDVGDEEVTAMLETLAPVRAVRGNVDGPDLPESLEFELAGHNFAMAHGHLFAAKNRHRMLTRAFPKANFILYGHTHVPVLEVLAGITVINPGSAGSKRFQLPVTCGILELPQNGSVGETYSWNLLDLEA
jgi:uncharacterized protein